MTITPHLFEAFLKCPTKGWFRFTSEPPAGNAYAEWVQTENESYRAEAAKRLIATAPADECPPSLGSSRREEAPYLAENLKTAKWSMAKDVPVRTELRSSRVAEAQTSSPPSSVRDSKPDDQSLLTSAATIIESRLHAVERIPSERRGKAAQFVPIRSIFRNKLTQDDRLLLAFDASVLSQVLGRDVRFGKIVHCDDHTTLKVKLGARTAESVRPSVTSKGLLGEVRKRIEKITALLACGTNDRSADSHVRELEADGKGTRGLGGPRSGPPPPDLVLNRHCAECEFRDRCRKLAVEKDDLSLLAGMSAKERQKLRSKPANRCAIKREAEQRRSTLTS